MTENCVAMSDRVMYQRLHPILAKHGLSPAQLDNDDELIELGLAKETPDGIVYRTQDLKWPGGDDVVPKIKIKIDDPKTRAIWASVQRAKVEVASWPAWKRGEDGPCEEK